MSDIHNIVNDIENSVLVIGPEIIQDSEGKALVNAFTERFAQRNKSLIKHYFDCDNLIRPRNEHTQVTIQKNFAEFYQGTFSEHMKAMCIKISQIPFPLIISLNPDITLKNCFDDLKNEPKAADHPCTKIFDYTFDFYKKGKNNFDCASPSSEKPYLFNLFGCYTEPDSLILSYDDLFEYLQNALNGCLPSSITTKLKDTRNITFLGFSFDKWYFQLLAKLLTQFDDKYEMLRYAAPDMSSSENIKLICENNFEITFVGPDASNFVNELYYHCYSKSILRGEADKLGGKVFSPEIFISYRHKGESEVIADNLYEAARTKEYNIVFDKTDLKFGGKVREFMKRLGWGEYVIIIVSDDYLKSEYCMYEFIMIMRNDGLTQNRVFPIVMPDADFYKETSRNKYENYWNDEIMKIKFNIKDSKSVANLRESIKTIELYEEFIQRIPEVIDFLNNRNSLTYLIHQSENFASLFEAIDAKIQEDLRT